MYKKMIVENKSRRLGAAFMKAAFLHAGLNEFKEDLFSLAQKSENSLSKYQWMKIKEEKDVRHALLFVDYLCEDFKKLAELSLENDLVTWMHVLRIIDECRHDLVQELISLQNLVRSRK